ncbi:DUF2442 domain-containing protein [Dolichospermum circinale CS-1225]|uniref:DUF2442 domain-containing protein n=1 Tax=Dolichospermum circinale CS-537/01 TaxID=3021739 RepID=A0ABT5A3L9_9CYAN|nr:DUF2442 domain-containing protein [Dolichospermum circinale]MDB9468759.1 DUF2442 domain-containing protein [Dolichospermum circinale CS-539/09]MDB9472187.1 DUF2442 domain-containing protein [Dolichospermum circinale CS-539]MDB9486519.1 DUF2442 domain-containing protein [Dolichospermum circinale CS-537/01]MDB9521937.1 DUF2442 domain-containing protein [Dolichospermum circinale CS-1225]
MLQDIIEVIPQNNYQLYLKFDDGKQGIVDVSQLIEFTGVFQLLQDLDFFKTVKINPEWGTIYWDNGADLDPDVLYSLITGESIPSYHGNQYVKISH